MKYSSMARSHFLVVTEKAIETSFFFFGVVKVVFFMSMSEIPIECSDKIPVIINFFLTKFDRIDGDMYSELRQSVLYNSQIEHILILRLRLQNDPIYHNYSWKIVVDNTAVDDTFA